ncbi:fused MFS/spermidine synthase [Megalodesulfovibrio paquesii]
MSPLFMLCVCHGLVFLAAALLFQVELIAAKALLPGFGGSSLVWAASVLVFQALLLGGYAWAAAIGNQLERPAARVLHAALFLAPAALFPISLATLSTPDQTFAGWEYGSWPAIALMLATTVGPGFAMLATVSVVCQRVLAASELPQASRPYTLYATSNLGSFAGLLSYPLLVEPFVDLDDQLRVWQVGYVLVAGLLGLLLWRLKPRLCGVALQKIPAFQGLSRMLQLRWLALSAAGSALFIATTNVVTMDLAAIPLLWIIPLALYLLSFVLVFKPTPWLPAWVRTRFSLALAVGSLLFLLSQLSYHLPVMVALPAYWLTLLMVCLICHGELARTAPADPRRLGRFYLLLSLGGALGSLLASFLAPLAFVTLAEYPAALGLAAAGLALGQREGRRRWDRPLRMLGMLALILAWPLALSRWPDLPTNVLAGVAGMGMALLYFRLERRPGTAALMLLVLMAAAQWLTLHAGGGNVRSVHRNFYGITTVYDGEDKRHLKHGTTLHGSQYLDPARASEALTYYHRTTPSGALLSRQEDVLDTVAPLGIVGLGAGSLAVYARPGQPVDIFELDPHNGDVARHWFSFLERSPGKVSLTFGDARLTLRQAPDAHYGILVVDAFNSDSIPVHLLTREALDEYARVLQPDGVLLLHISNKYLELAPVVTATGRAGGQAGKWFVLEKTYRGTVHPDADACQWMALTREPTGRGTALRLAERFGWRWMPEEDKAIRPWTDRYSNVLGVLK